MKCVLGRSEHVKPRANLYVFPHSGGMPGAYLQWKKNLDQTNVFGIQYPGRGSRMTEAHCTSIDEIVEDIMNWNGFETPSIFFGHSLGAVVAYEVACRTAKQGRPSALVVSAMVSPNNRIVRAGSNNLSSEDVLDELKLNDPVTFSEISSSGPFLEMFVQLLKADLKAGSNYTFTPRPPLAMPLIYMGGKADTIVSSKYEEWRDFTTGPFESHLFEGGHFYFNQDHVQFFSRLNQIIQKLAHDAALVVRQT